MKSFFTDDEKKCPCCGKFLMDLAFMDRLNAARWIAGFPFVIISGYRCPEHNKKVGSTSDNHIRGMAADIRCMFADRRYEIVKAMIGAGMLGIGVGKSFVHGDINRSIPAMWIH